MASILIVDDEIFIRDVAELIIGDLGHKTSIAGDVADALLLLQPPATIDVLFTDIRLRKLVHGGFELAKQARQLQPNLRVLYTTGSVNVDDMMALSVPGSQLLRKPYEPEQLQNSIEVLLAAEAQ